MNSEPSTGRFAPTRWTLVLRARGETSDSRAALAELCETYYQPVLRFLFQEGRTQDQARELAQDFFARVLANGFGQVDPERGRFRSYLLGALKHFLADQRKYHQRQKRGEGHIEPSLDQPDAVRDSDLIDSSAPTPDSAFDRQWALTMVNQGILQLERDFATDGKTDLFLALKPWLVGEPAIAQAEVARQLGLTEGAVKVAIHRLRKRLRDIVRTEIAQTLREPTSALVDAELQHLAAALT